MPDPFQTAMKAFINGQIKQTEKICKAILKQQPTAHPALHLLAMTEKRRGKYQLAIRTFQRALKLSPSTSMYWNNLGETYREIGNHAKAIESYQKAIRHRPEYAEAYCNWGATLLGMGDNIAAEQHLKKATELNPQLANAHYNLGVLYTGNNSPGPARQAFECCLSIESSNVEALVNLACLDQEEERFDQAKTNYLRAIAIDSTNLKAHLNLGSLYNNNEQSKEAIQYYSAAKKINQKSFDAWLGLGQSNLQDGLFLDAYHAFKQAISLNKNSKEAILGLASTSLNTCNANEAECILRKYKKSFGEDPQLHLQLALTYLHDRNWTSAEIEARRCLALDPQNIFAYQTITQIKHVNGIENDLQDMLELYNQNKLPEKQQSTLAFSIAKAMDMTGDHEGAFFYLEQGNQIWIGDNNIAANTINETRAIVEKIRTTFTPDFIKLHEKSGFYDDTPIFIIGLPRSGKTVTETALSLSTLVTPAGESRDFANMVATLLSTEHQKEFPDGVELLSESHYRLIGNAYISTLKKRFKTNNRITNTLPGNIYHLGMIRLCLPKAKVIWIERNIKDNCFDMYRKNFSRGHKYSYDLGALGEYILLFKQLMKHWDQLFPEFIYSLKFEELISDPETQLQALATFCNLDCKEMKKEYIDIKEETSYSFSSYMPASDEAIGIWKPYEKHLTPLFKTLEKQLTKLEGV